VSGEKLLKKKLQRERHQFFLPLFSTLRDKKLKFKKNESSKCSGFTRGDCFGQLAGASSLEVPGARMTHIARRPETIA
jgi:hypothetical protein